MRCAIAYPWTGPSETTRRNEQVERALREIRFRWVDHTYGFYLYTQGHVEVQGVGVPMDFR